MKFQYVAKDKLGKSFDGQFEGDSALAVRQRLRSQGLFALSVVAMDARSKTTQSLTKKSQLSPSLFDGFQSPRVKGSDLIVALSQLSIMCQSGDDLAEAQISANLQS
jgi:type II secretory pathway component PulF